MRRVIASLVAFFAIIAASVAIAAPAQADESGCGQFWPTQGRVTTRWDGDFHHATLAFRLTQSQLDMLRCTGSYLEIDFTWYQVTIPGNSEDYDIYSNLPQAAHDIGFSDSTFSPGITGVPTDQLQAGYPYYATVEFNSGTNGNPTVSVGFVASHWAHQDNPKEVVACLRSLGTLGNRPGWCVFPSARRSITNDLYGWPVPADGSAYTIDPSNFSSF